MIVLLLLEVQLPYDLSRPLSRLNNVFYERMDMKRTDKVSSRSHFGSNKEILRYKSSLKSLKMLCLVGKRTQELFFHIRTYKHRENVFFHKYIQHNFYHFILRYSWSWQTYHKLKTRDPIAEWKCNFALFMEIMVDWPTDRPSRIEQGS